MRSSARYALAACSLVSSHVLSLGRHLPGIQSGTRRYTGGAGGDAALAFTIRRAIAAAGFNRGSSLEPVG